MSEIRNLTRNGETFYPLTTSSAVINEATGEGLVIDNEPTPNSDNLVKSGGVYNKLYGNLTLGFYLDQNGNSVANENYGYSDYIPVSSGVTITVFVNAVVFNNAAKIITYDAWKNVYSYYSDYGVNGTTFEPSASVRYIRISAGLGVNHAKVVRQSDSKVIWEADLGMNGDIKQVQNEVDNLKENVDGTVTQSGVYFANDGSLVSDENYGISDYIPVNSSNNFDLKLAYNDNNCKIIAYDENKAYKTYYSANYSRAYSYGTAYVRVSFRLYDLNEAYYINNTTNTVLWKRIIQVNTFSQQIANEVVNLEKTASYTVLGNNILSAITDHRNRVCKNVKDNRLSFGFVTDVHLTSSGGVRDLRRLYTLSKDTKASASRFILFGGDLVSGEDSIPLDMQIMLNGKEALNDNFGLPAYIVRGNHDGGHKTWKAKVDGGGVATDVDVVSNDDWYNMIVSSENGIVRDQSNSMGAYYYKDFDDAKIRLIVLNCYDMLGTNPDGNVYNAMWSASALWQKQIDWLVDIALNFTDKGNDKTNWGVIVASHEGVISDNSPYGNGANVELILQVFKNGSQYDYSYSYQSDPNYYSAKNVDFRSQGAMNYIAYIHGHTHTDRVIFDENIPIISTGASHPDNTEDVPAGATLALPRVDGELSEYLWDTIAIGDNEIDIFRFGAGHNRFVHLGGNNIAIGENITLTAQKLSGTLTWGAFSNSPGYYTPIVNGAAGTPVGTLLQNATVVDGIVTGISAGSATIYAEDENGNREFFGIVVS